MTYIKEYDYIVGIVGIVGIVRNIALANNKEKTRSNQMLLKDIKSINQRIYVLDPEIKRESKVIFISALIFCYRLNKDFQNPAKLTALVNFVDEKTRPIDQIIDIAKAEIVKLELLPKTQQAIFDSLQTISGVNTKLDRDRDAFKSFVSDFITNDFPSIKSDDLFLETLYMEIDKKAKKSDEGVVLTPIFAAQLMIDLADINYKNDVVADLCSGTGLFSLLSYSQMLGDMDRDLKAKEITKEEYKIYQEKLYNSIIANDVDPKMVTLCLANFLLKSLNHSLLYNENVLKLEKSDFKIKNGDQQQTIQATKAVLNPPYEDAYKPVEIVEKCISLVKNSNGMDSRVVVIIPPQKFGQKKDIFSQILKGATLESVIKMQDDLFVESGKTQPTSIFIFNASKPHSKEDKIKYYDFTDTGFVYLKDSGLVDKNNTYEAKKKRLLEAVKSDDAEKSSNSFIRTWGNFYEVDKQFLITAQIDPSRIKIDKEEADITLENITIKKMLGEKQKLLDDASNNYIDKDGSFEKYIIGILSED